MIKLLIIHNEIIRNWSLFIFAFVGTALTLRTFRSNIKQRKLENTFKLIDFMRKHITENEISKIITLFHANNPLAGHPEKFVHSKDNEEPVVYMFSEGGCGNGEVHNTLEVFNLISKSLIAKSVVVEMVWYEYGQLMNITYNWLKYIEDHDDSKIPTMKRGKIKYEKLQLWPNFTKFMSGRQPNYKSPMKPYTYAE